MQPAACLTPYHTGRTLATCRACGMKRVVLAHGEGPITWGGGAQSPLDFMSLQRGAGCHKAPAARPTESFRYVVQAPSTTCCLAPNPPPCLRRPPPAAAHQHRHPAMYQLHPPHSHPLPPALAPLPQTEGGVAAEAAPPACVASLLLLLLLVLQPLLVLGLLAEVEAAEDLGGVTPPAPHPPAPHPSPLCCQAPSRASPQLPLPLGALPPWGACDVRVAGWRRWRWRAVWSAWVVRRGCCLSPACAHTPQAHGDP